MNEWGLVIGNEAVYTKPHREEVNEFLRGKPASPGLLGMDMIRIALERCTTAIQAVELIAALVEQHGQFGSGSPGAPHDSGSYDNAFLIADPDEAWILETAGRRWAARRLLQGSTSISNQLSIRADWDLGSQDLISYAMKNGWWEKSAPEFDFARAYIDETVSRQVSHIRMMRSRQLLEQRSGQITPQWMMRIARDHYEDTFLQGPVFDAANPDFLSLCMHVSPANFTWGNTASSCVAVLHDEPGSLPVFWWTPGPPCNGCYVPFFAHSSRLPEIVSIAGTEGKHVTPANRAGEDTYVRDSYWWAFRRLNDWVKGDTLGSKPGLYQERNSLVRARFDALEQSFSLQAQDAVKHAASYQERNPILMAEVLDSFTEACVQQVMETINDLQK